MVTSACAEPPRAQDAGTDAGRCGASARIQGDAGYVLLKAVLCGSPDASIFWNNESIAVQWPDGGALDTRSCGTSDCDSCGLICDDFPFIAETSRTQTFQLRWDARDRSKMSTCADPSKAPCHLSELVPFGTYRARFCVSRSATRNSAGTPTALGPLECVEELIKVPLDTQFLEVAF